MIETRDGQMQAQMRQRLHELQLEHRDLDAAIHRISDDPSHDQLALTRMKRRKLLLKDQISWIERQLDPDIPA
ncbi:MAG TPA: YdcH family protein [Burkholderiales bacterium]|nr:YdcH family protein [Burkholderiales bacterium]